MSKDREDWDWSRRRIDDRGGADDGNGVEGALSSSCGCGGAERWSREGRSGTECIDDLWEAQHRILEWMINALLVDQ